MRDAEPKVERRSSIGWHLERPRRRVMPVVWAALAALFGWLAWMAFVEGGPVGAAVPLVIAAALVWMVPAPRRVAREPRTVPSGQGLGVLLPMQGKSLRFVAIGSLCIVLALVAGVRGLLNRELLPSVFVIGLAVLAAIAMADELQMRRRGPRGLVLTPSGVELHDRNPVETWAWDRIGDVHAWHTWVPMHNANHLPFGPRPEASNRLTLTVRPPGAAGTPDRGTGHGDADIESDDLLCDPVAAFHFLRLYATGPSLRWELGSDAALRRWGVLTGATRP